MSDTAANMMDRIRTLTDDRNQAGYEVSGTRMLAMLSSRLIQTVAELPPGDTPRTDLVTLVSGTDEYTLGGVSPSFVGLMTVTYSDSTNAYSKTPLTKSSVDDLVAVRLMGYRGAPRKFATYERASDNTVRIIINPIPTDTEAGKTLTVWTQDASSGVSDPTTTVYMQPSLLRAVEKAVAAECLSSMTAEALQRRGIDKNLAQVWVSDWQNGIRAERARLNSIRRAAGVVLKRA